MTLAPQQQALFETLAANLDARRTEAALRGQVDGMLASLLRRQGDERFLLAVRNAFAEGTAGRKLADQHQLARELIGLVIEKRPEIARAWSALNPEPAPPVQRRATDQPDSAVADAPAPSERPPYQHATVEALVAHHIAGTLVKKLAAFQVPPPPPPSVAYCAGQPFFLFRPAFAQALDEFVRVQLVAFCRPPLERHVYADFDPRKLADDSKRKAFIAGKRKAIWKIIGQKLNRLGTNHANARAKLELAAHPPEVAPPEFRIVQVPVKTKRVYRVLGVEFRFGEITTTQAVKVKNRPATELEESERQAVAMLDAWREICARHGAPVPEAADFQFLRCLQEMDGRRFAQLVEEYVQLASHPETTRAYLFDRLAYVDKTYSNFLSDALVLVLFYRLSDRGFTFKELYDACIGAGRSSGAIASKRPFLQAEVYRRLPDLVAQLHGLIARGSDGETVAAAAAMLLSSWRVLNPLRFKRVLELARTALTGLPAGFTGGRARLAAELVRLLLAAIDDREQDDEAAIVAIGRAVAAAAAPAPQRAVG